MADVVTCPLLSVFKVLIAAYHQLRWVTELRDVFAKAVPIAGSLQAWEAGRGRRVIMGKSPVGPLCHPKSDVMYGISSSI